MKITDFEKNLQEEIDENITIEHDDRSPEGLSGVYYKGKSICGCPQYEIREKSDHGYGVEINRGNDNFVFVRHRTIDEVIAMVSGTVGNIKRDKDYADAFFGEGQYSEEALKDDTPKKKPEDYKIG